MGEGQGCKKVKVQNSRAAAVVVLVQITEIGYRAVGHSASIFCKILSAKITASAMMECRAGDGSNWKIKPRSLF